MADALSTTADTEKAAGGVRVWLETLAWGGLVTVALPQLFVFMYFFALLVTGMNRLALLRSLALLGLTFSWVSAPFFAVALLLYKLLVARKVRGIVVFLVCTLAGYLWVCLWNVWIFPLFSCGRAVLPVLVCSLLTTGYALMRVMYLGSLPPRGRAQRADGAGAPPGTGGDAAGAGLPG
jgi:hypothetical protein